MNDILEEAKANRCVLLRGSENYDEFYSTFATLIYLRALLTKNSLPYHDELLPAWTYAQGKSWGTRASGA